MMEYFWVEPITFPEEFVQSKQGMTMNQYLYRLLPVRTEMVTVGPTPEERAIVSEHFARLKVLTEQGVVLLAGRTQDNSPSTFGIVIFQADSVEQALEIMNDDPVLREGVMRAELFPFRIALAGNVEST